MISEIQNQSLKIVFKNKNYSSLMLKEALICENKTCSTLVNVLSSGMSENPFESIWRERSRVLYNLSLTSPRITRQGSFIGICFQNSAIREGKKLTSDQNIFPVQILAYNKENKINDSCKEIFFFLTKQKQINNNSQIQHYN